MEEKLLCQFTKVLNTTLDKKFKEQDVKWKKELDKKFAEYNAKNVKEISDELFRIAESAGSVDKGLENKINVLEEKMDTRFNKVENELSSIRIELKITQKNDIIKNRI